MGSPSMAYETPKEEMTEPVVQETSDEELEKKVDSNSIKNRLLELDPVVSDAYHTIAIAMESNPELFGTFMNSFSLSMSRAVNTCHDLDSPLTVAKFAAKGFFDQWIETAKQLPAKS